jgi:methylthioribose-1-phosphate isomerase
VPYNSLVAPEDLDKVRAVRWDGGGLLLLDQRLLPGKVRYLNLRNAGAVAQAIAEMAVRGAPAIGICAAYGVVLAIRDRYARNPSTWRRDVEADVELLGRARPTAVNLRWALERMTSRIAACSGGNPYRELLQEAEAIHLEDIQANRRMGALGAALIEGPCQVLTHCNTGSLATGGYGTALGVIRSAYAERNVTRVFVDETRPWLQGARLTAWELAADGIPATVLVDAAAAHLLRRGAVSWVIVGADRVTANGDVANKIGTYGLAVLCRYHKVPLMVVAPSSTIDLRVEHGAAIPIEERDPAEVLFCAGRRVTPEVEAINPAFDVTPADLVDVLVTERGVVLRPSAAKIHGLFDESARSA